jgi:hypothetical protein
VCGAGRAPPARLEDLLDLAVIDAGPVVGDRDSHVDAGALDGDGRLGRGVQARVLDHRVEDPLDRVRVAGDGLHRRVVQDEVHAALVGERRARAHDGPGSDRRIGAAPGQSRLVPGGGKERLDDPGELLGVTEHRHECASVVGRRAGPAQGELGLGLDSRERRAQLVGELRCEPLFLPHGRGDAPEQCVERRGEGGDLVPRRPGREAPVEIRRAPRHRIARHLRDGAQCEAQEPVDEHGDDAQNSQAEDDRRP